MRSDKKYTCILCLILIVFVRAAILTFLGVMVRDYSRGVGLACALPNSKKTDSTLLCTSATGILYITKYRLPCSRSYPVGHVLSRHSVCSVAVDKGISGAASPYPPPNKVYISEDIRALHSFQTWVSEVRQPDSGEMSDGWWRSFQ
jgi:hypothetical protein